MNQKKEKAIKAPHLRIVQHVSYTALPLHVLWLYCLQFCICWLKLCQLNFKWIDTLLVWSLDARTALIKYPHTCFSVWRFCMNWACNMKEIYPLLYKTMITNIWQLHSPSTQCSNGIHKYLFQYFDTFLHRGCYFSQVEIPIFNCGMCIVYPILYLRLSTASGDSVNI